MKEQSYYKKVIYNLCVWSKKLLQSKHIFTKFWLKKQNNPNINILFPEVTASLNFVLILPLYYYHLCMHFFLFINLFIYLFLAVLGLCCCAWAFFSCGEQGLLLLQSMGCRHVGFGSCGLRAVEHRLSSGSQAQLLCGTWDLPGPGLEPVSPVFAGGFLTTVPPGKPLHF